VGEGGIFISWSSGFDWSWRTGGSFEVVALSADGDLIAAASYSHGLMTSMDKGATWNQQANGPPLGWQWSSLISSVNGTVLMLGGFDKEKSSGGVIFVSIDGGANWTRQDTGVAFAGGPVSIASSSSGTRLVASVYSGSIYTTEIMPRMTYYKLPSRHVARTRERIEAEEEVVRDLEGTPGPVERQVQASPSPSPGMAFWRRLMLIVVALSCSLFQRRKEGWR